MTTRNGGLADRLAAIILDSATADSTPDVSAPRPESVGRTRPPGAYPQPEGQVADPLALVQLCLRADAAIREFTQHAIDAARAAGYSWAEIGKTLGMSRQAAQQRFGGSLDELPPDERWLGPVTAFDELAELELAGRLGWHTVGAGMLRHRMVRTATQWEHRRLLWPKSTAKLVRDGWQIGCRAFPWVYLIRDTGLPADSDEPPVDAVAPDGVDRDSSPQRVAPVTSQRSPR